MKRATRKHGDGTLGEATRFAGAVMAAQAHQRGRLRGQPLIDAMWTALLDTYVASDAVILAGDVDAFLLKLARAAARVVVD